MSKKTSFSTILLFLTIFFGLIMPLIAGFTYKHVSQSVGGIMLNSIYIGLILLAIVYIYYIYEIYSSNRITIYEKQFGYF